MKGRELRLPLRLRALCLLMIRRRLQSMRLSRTNEFRPARRNHMIRVSRARSNIYSVIYDSEVDLSKKTQQIIPVMHIWTVVNIMRDVSLGGGSKMKEIDRLFVRKF